VSGSDSRLKAIGIIVSSLSWYNDMIDQFPEDYYDIYVSGICDNLEEEYPYREKHNKLLRVPRSYGYHKSLRILHEQATSEQSWPVGDIFYTMNYWCLRVRTK